MSIGQLAIISAIGGAVIIEALRALAVTVAQLINEEREARREAAVAARRAEARAHAQYRAQFERSMERITDLQKGE